MQRLSTLSNQIVNKQKGKQSDDVVICCALRTPLTRAKKGNLKDTPPEILVKTVLEGIADRTKIDKQLVQEIVFGNVIIPGSAGKQVRIGMFLAGFPKTTTVMTINRFCSSGLEAVAIVAAKIKAGLIDIGIAGGVEQMSMFDMQKVVDKSKMSDEINSNPEALACMLPMGLTSENVASQFNISREIQDKFSLESHRKAGQAQDQGYFKDEIIPVKTKCSDKDGQMKEVIVSKDDGIRKETSYESLQKLKPAFKEGGTTTAGNSSQTTEGASGILLARRSVAEKLNLPILARFVGYSVTGVSPEIMGVGPLYAIPEVLKQVGLTKEDIGIFEINEAFASQAYYCINQLGIEMKKVNPKGGAIALGHPLGATGARQIATLLPELKRQNQKYGLVSMCIGSGMGAACVLENEQ